MNKHFTEKTMQKAFSKYEKILTSICKYEKILNTQFSFIMLAKIKCFL